MKRIVLLTAVLLAAFPLQVKAQTSKPADDSRLEQPADRAPAADDHVRASGGGKTDGQAAATKRLKPEEIASLIADLQQTRSELQAQIETQRRQVIKLEQDIARIIDSMQDQARPAAGSCLPVTSTENRPLPDSPSADAAIAEESGIDHGEGWIRNEATGDTISWQDGQIRLAGRDGKAIDRPAAMLVARETPRPAASLRVGNLDVTFSPNVSRQVQLAFLHYPATPGEPVRHNALYADSAQGRFSATRPTAQQAVATRENGRGEVLKIRTGKPPVAHATAETTGRRPGRPPQTVSITRAESGEWRLHPVAVPKRTDESVKGIPVGIGQRNSPGNTEKFTGIDLRREPVKTDMAEKAKGKVAMLQVQDAIGRPGSAIVPKGGHRAAEG